MPSSITNIDLNHKDRPRYSIVGARLIVQFLLSNFRRQRSPLPLPLSFPDRFLSLSLLISASAHFFFTSFHFPSVTTYQSTYSARFMPPLVAFPPDENRERRGAEYDHRAFNHRSSCCFPTAVGIVHCPRGCCGRGDAIIFAKFAEMRLSFASIARLSSRKMRLSTAWRRAFAPLPLPSPPTK